MVNIGTRVALVHIAFSSRKNAALIERKNVAIHNFIYKTPSLYIERNKKHSCYIVGRPCLCLDALS